MSGRLQEGSLQRPLSGSLTNVPDLAGVIYRAAGKVLLTKSCEYDSAVLLILRTVFGQASAAVDVWHVNRPSPTATVYRIFRGEKRSN